MTIAQAPIQTIPNSGLFPLSTGLAPDTLRKTDPMVAPERVRRERHTKIVATIGPASSQPDQIRELFLAGADVFRLNFSHGSHKDHQARYQTIRALEAEMQHPIAILLDLQGPKLRVGNFAAGCADIVAGQSFSFDLDPTPGDTLRAPLLHPEIYAAVSPGDLLLVDDGKLRFSVVSRTSQQCHTIALNSGVISNRKGVNVPTAILPLSALTEKDRADLAFGLELGVDWIALSFVQSAADMEELRTIVGPRASLMAKLEKPSAIEQLEQIIAVSDGIMVARGDLGVELNPEEVPPLQKRIVAATRRSGKPVIVATQMLESMIESPAPTRAEVSDVANAVYDGADAVMLSAETAAGAWPEEAVTIMHRIATQVESDPGYGERVHFTEVRPDATTADALAEACAQITQTLPIAGVIVFTGSGSTARRVARERPGVRILVLTPSIKTARKVALLWGAYPVLTKDIGSFEEMIAKGRRMALRHGFGTAGSKLIALAGVPFGTPGATNLLHVVTLSGDELKRHASGSARD